MTGLRSWAEQRLRHLELVIHHPEPQLPAPESWDGSWTGRCPRCKQDATWQRQPTEPAARIHCPCR